MTGPAIERLAIAPIKEIVVTNTIELPIERQLDNMTILSMADLLADAIYRIYKEQSVSTLFQ